MNDLHRPIERNIPGAKKAVLLIHGLLGTPRFWQDFVAATPEDVALHALLLPGHGGTVPEFGHVPWGAWRKAVTEAVEALCAQHEQVFIVAHSLGTLLAINSLTAHPAPVRGMLFIAAPLRLRMSAKTVLGNIRKGLGAGESREALACYYGTEPDVRVWRYVSWLPRYVEFFRESAAARRGLPRLSIPTQAFLSPRDELVSPRSSTPLRSCPTMTLTMLSTSGHHAFTPEELSQMLAAYRQMIGC